MTLSAHVRILKRSEPVPGLAERLRERVDALGGMSAVSADIGIQYGTLYKWIRGEHQIPLWGLCALALYLETSVESLLGVAATPAQEAKRLDIYDDYAVWAKRKRTRERETRRRKRTAKVQVVS